MPKLPTKLTKENILAFINSFDTLLTDCDGVIWSGDNVIDRANKTIDKLHSLGKKVFLLTNNSTKSRTEFVQKCEKLEFNCQKEHIVSSSSVMATYLKQLNFNKKVYVVGTKGIGGELDSVGIEHIGIGPDPMVGEPFHLVQSTKLDPEVGAVVVGFDGHFSVPKILKAASYINTVPDCLFISTNTDENFPVLGTTLVYPGTGCFVRAVETVVGKKSQVMGKPEPRMFEVVQKEYNLDPKRTIMVGDRCNTDILLGKNCGLNTLMVLTGVHSIEDVTEWVQGDDEDLHRQVPDFYVPSFGTLLDLLGD